MEQTERTLRSPGEESAPLSEARMQERNTHYLSLEALGFIQSRKLPQERREEQLAAHRWALRGKQTLPVNRRQDLRGEESSQGWTEQYQSKNCAGAARGLKLRIQQFLLCFIIRWSFKTGLMWQKMYSIYQKWTQGKAISLSVSL